MEYNIERFVEAQESSYNQALKEIRNGHKTSHWMWYIFPQLKELGRSSTAKFYGLVCHIIPKYKEDGNYGVQPVIDYESVYENTNRFNAIYEKMKDRL